MNLDQVISSLEEYFLEPLNEGEIRKIVFWIDKDQEFTDEIENLSLHNVKIHELTANNSFYTKYLLEEEDPISNYLIYTTEDLSDTDNWLIDTVSYSKTFYADKISLLLSDLKIDPSLGAIVKKYEKFFNKKHTQKLKSYEMENFTEETIEVAIMSVLCNLKASNFEEVLKNVLMEGLEETENKYYEALKKYCDIDMFWKYVSHMYGYDFEQKSLKTLFMFLTVTALSHSIEEQYLFHIANFISGRNKSNSLVFVDHWMHHKTDYSFYDEMAERAEQELSLANLVKEMPLNAFKEADVFPYFDKAIIMYIANGLQASIEDYEEFIDLINLRRVKHFYERYQSVYEALFYTVKVVQFYKKYETGIPAASAVDMWKHYVHEYYQMDTYYRKFYVAYDREPNSEILKKLREIVENHYTNWYMGDLSSHWSQALEEVKEQWLLPGVINQQDIYRFYIAPKVQKGERLFVIVSDALRYEAAVELAEKLNSETRGACEIEAVLGVIPSVTKLGMAVLLPHTEIDFDKDAGVMVNGKSSSGLENRRAIIEASIPEGVAVNAQDVFSMNKAGRREFFKGKKLIYLYHDTIDAMGDKASTEVYTFNAVEKAIEEISTLIKMIRDDLSATNILITADHGFLYQREPLAESDKIGKEDIDAVEMKRRYVLSSEDRQLEGIMTIPLESMIKNVQHLRAYVPKATIRFKTQGSGVNFVHGGASLQEVAVPLIRYKNIRRGQANSKEIEQVDIKLTNTIRKITNRLFYLSFFQTEKVEGKRIARTVLIFMTDEEGSVISNEETIIGDRTSDNPEERTFKLRFALKSIPYDKNKNYYLIIQDRGTGVIQDKIPFTINLSMISDFDF